MKKARNEMGLGLNLGEVNIVGGRGIRVWRGLGQAIDGELYELLSVKRWC